MMYGLWITDPGKWTGWFSLAMNEKQHPTRFSKEEAEERAARYRANVPSATVDVRADPPAALPWNEKEWKKVTA